MTQTKLKPCPFCGEEPMLIHRKREKSLPKQWQAMCDERCSAPQFIRGEDRNEVIETWNRRMTDESTTY